MIRVAIANFENKYEVDCLGTIYSLVTNKKLKPFYNAQGYEGVRLYRGDGTHKDFRVNRLVAETFIPNPENLRCVNHKDGNKINNTVENLEWMTHKQNTIHAFQTGLMKNPKGLDSWHCKKVRCINTGEIFLSLDEAAKARNKSRPNLSAHLAGKRYSFDKMKWEWI